MPNLLAGERLNRWARVCGTAFATLAVTAGAVLAATPVGDKALDEHVGGLPQLNPASFPSQIFWLAITFIALYWLMSKKALPRVAEVLEERQERISRDLGKAAQIKEEAEAVMAAVDKALADARAEAGAILNQTVLDIDAANAARLAQLNADIAERLREAEARIMAAKDEALANVRTAAADIARDIVGRLAGVDADPAQAEAAVVAVIEERR